MKKHVFMKATFVLTLVLSLVVLTSCKKKFTVTFNSNGGTAVAEVEVKKGEKVEKPADPTREGFEFEGWTLDGELYNFNQEVNSNITLIAKWKEKSQVVENKGEAPKNVQMSDTTISWDSVDSATGYVVYINGVAKSVQGTSIQLSEIATLLNNVEDVICVTSQFGEDESSPSIPLVKRGNISDSEVNEIMQSLANMNLSKEQAKEIAYTMKKYQISVSDLTNLMQTIDTTSPQAFMQTCITLLDNPKLVGIIETLFVMGYGQVQNFVNQLESMPTVTLTENDKALINEMYNSIKEMGYMGKDDAFEDKLYVEIVLPWISSIVASKNLMDNTMAMNQLIVLGTYIYGWYLSSQDFKATRNGQVITIQMSNEVITTNFQEISQLFVAALQFDSAYTTVLETYYQVKIFPVAIQAFKEIKPMLEANYEKAKGMISVYLPVFVDGVKNILSMTDMMNGLVEAVQNIVNQLQNVQSEEEFKEVVKSANAFKNQALDAIIEVLPTQKQWNAITAVMDYCLGNTEEGKAFVQSFTYNKVTEFAQVLSSFKTLDLTKYDIMTVVNAIMMQDEESIQAAKVVIMQMLNDIETLLPKKEQQPKTLEEICEEIMKKLQQTEAESFPILSLLNVIFGEEVTNESVEKVMICVNEFVEYVVNYPFDEAKVKAIIEQIMANGYVDYECASQLAMIGVEVLFGFVDEEKIVQFKGVVLKVLELVKPEYVEMVNGIIEIVNKHLDVFKEWSQLNMSSAMNQDIANLEAIIDANIAFASSAKYETFRNAMREIYNLIEGPEATDEQFNAFVPTDLATKLQQAKALIGIQEYALTEEQRNLIGEITGTCLVIEWIYPEADFIQLSLENNTLVIRLDETKLPANYSYWCWDFYELEAKSNDFLNGSILRLGSDVWGSIDSISVNLNNLFRGVEYKYYLNIQVYVEVDSNVYDYVGTIDITEYVMMANMTDVEYPEYSVNYAY